MKKCKLGDLLEIQHGYAFKSENYLHQGKFALVTLANISESNNFQFNEDNLTYYESDFPKNMILNEGDLIMPMTEQVIGLLGNSAFIPVVKNFSFVLNQRVGKVIPKSCVDKYYLHYLLATNEVKTQLEYRASGTKQRNISPDNIYDVTVYVPELHLQEKIGSVLYSIEKKINLNKKINATLEAMAKTLYDYWFVQFDFPDENGKPYKTSGGKMIYNAELGREIPAGWEIKGLAQIANIVQGNSPNGTTLNETGKGMIFFQGKTDFGFRFPEVRIYTTAPYRLAEKFDTLLSVRAPVGAVNMAHERCCIGRGLAAIKSDYPSFIYYTMIRLQSYLEKLSGIGTTFDSITKDDIMALKICIPPKNFIKMFDAVVSKYDNEILLKTDENDCLAALRDWLLPMLMNGQIKFK